MRSDSELSRDTISLAESLLGSIKPIERFMVRFYVVIFVVILFFCLSLPLRSPGEHYFSMFSLAFGQSVIVFMAATSVGLLLGFLFGIPKSLQKTSPTGIPASDHKDYADSSTSSGAARAGRNYFTNTSLEEISDWLTKIIIGIGLVQFNTIVVHIYNVSNYSSSFIAKKAISIDIPYDGNISLPFFMALILCAAISGCLFSYLETRTRLTLIFIGAEHTFETSEIGQLLRAPPRAITLENQSNERRGADRPEPPTAADEKLAKVGRADLTDPKALVNWASSQARLGNLVVAEDALRDALQRDPDNLDIYSRIADVRRLRKNYAGALEIIQQGSKKAVNAKAKTAMIHRAILTALYIPPPDGFKQAIALSDDFIGSNSDVDPSVYLWRAAAFGQYFKWLAANAEPGVDAQAVRGQALAAVRKVVELCSEGSATERMLLRSMFRPSAEERAAGEDDLAVFGDDPEFVTAIEG